MTQPEATEKKKGLLDRLPKLGRVSQLVLLITIFLVVFILLWLFDQQQSKTQTTLGSTLTNLQTITAGAQTPKAKYEAELAQATAGADASRASFPAPDQAPEILDSLLELAKLNDIYVTQTAVTTSTPTGSIGPVLTFTLGLKGQIPKFQNFLLALDNKLPTSQIKQVTFTVTGVEEEYDTSSVTIEVLCYGGAK
ncbi:MAG: hypothetical protein MUO97_01215 [Dehalococcoidia bacterium]|jgi:hypothetical protein|nr:hypothetical protein [Dehalococcoidia bacterium]